MPSRKEINKLTSVELNLLFEGLAKFQNERAPTDPKSWFQIAGGTSIASRQLLVADSA